MGRYLVTGCAGFIGSHLAEALLSEGEQVVGVDSLTDYYARELKTATVDELHANSGFSFFEAAGSRPPSDGMQTTLPSPL